MSFHLLFFFAWTVFFPPNLAKWPSLPLFLSPWELASFWHGDFELTGIDENNLSHSATRFPQIPEISSLPPPYSSLFLSCLNSFPFPFCSEKYQISVSRGKMKEDFGFIQKILVVRLRSMLPSKLDLLCSIQSGGGDNSSAIIFLLFPGFLQTPANVSII